MDKSELQQMTFGKLVILAAKAAAESRTEDLELIGQAIDAKEEDKAEEIRRAISQDSGG